MWQPCWAGAPSSQDTEQPQQGGAQQGDSWMSQEAIHKCRLLVDSTEAQGFGSSVKLGVFDCPAGATAAFPIQKPEPPWEPCWRKHALGE